MFKFLKGLGKGGEPAPPVIAFGELPAWIIGEEAKAREELAGLVATHRPKVSDAVSTTKEVLARINRAGMEEVSHQKLAGVTEKSLPLFLKAMGTSLSRELPDDPEGFYSATAEILKGCLSAFRGQGRYLSSRFPVEMKTLRHGVDIIGREMNAMTPQIDGARKRLRALGDLRAAHEGYMDAKNRAAQGEEEIRSLGREVAASRDALESVRREIDGLGKGGECRAAREEIARIRKLEEERAGTGRLSHATAATALHLLKKGEKVASRKRDRDATRSLREATGLLEGELPLPEDTVSRILSPGLRALTALAASGDLAPKNREEKELLEEPGQLVERVTGFSRRFRELSAGIASAQEALSSRPVLAKSRELKRQAGELENRIARAAERTEEVKATAAGQRVRMQASLLDIQKKVDLLAGKPVTVTGVEPPGP
jgi:uncharacterized coiled-coil DUF342 family protein